MTWWSLTLGLLLCLGLSAVFGAILALLTVKWDLDG